MAAIYQVSKTRFIAVNKLPGSPCCLVRECYRTPESPTGWYTLPGDTLINARTTDAAAQAWVDAASTGKEA